MSILTYSHGCRRSLTLKKIWAFLLMAAPMLVCGNEIDFSFQKTLNNQFFNWVCTEGKADCIGDGSIELTGDGLIYHLTKYPLDNKQTLRLRFRASGKGTVGIFIYDHQGNLTRQIADRLPNSKEMRLFEVEYDLANELAGLDRNRLTVRLFFRSRDKLTISDKGLVYDFE